ncbi:hypothetical protein QTJ16_005656 [Diplocarpon rosae]|uniref:Clock-controlled protein 6 n=1 Tax=Diplocarpon rosae TaxID=946125 RepID=A0AAD9SXD0_9HELO|nr:hypothetical protein QTJ16_005656 [Diplocarpon rosae]PBP25090.1 hypothetical protein BUE80_DR003945 [Diplocarpon rosae]
MQFSTVAALALAATASAYYNGTVVYTTEIHEVYTTVCPVATEFAFNGITYTATEATTLTITNCPCTVVKPVVTSTYVYCATCAPTYTPPPSYPTSNGTTPAAGPTAVGTETYPVSPPASTTAPLTANGGNKVMAVSGGSLAGVFALAAFLL